MPQAAASTATLFTLVLKALAVRLYLLKQTFVVLAPPSVLVFAAT